MCHSVLSIVVRTDIGTSAKVDALVVKEKPLDFDMLLGYYAIKALGGVLIDDIGGMHFQETVLVCAALRIDQPNFRVDFNAQERHWTASWKWTDNIEPPKLTNRLAEYHVPRLMRRRWVNGLRMAGSYHIRRRDLGPRKHSSH